MSWLSSRSRFNERYVVASCHKFNDYRLQDDFAIAGWPAGPPKAKAKSVAGVVFGGDDDPRGLLRIEDASMRPPKAKGKAAVAAKRKAKATGKAAVAAKAKAAKAALPLPPPPLPPPPVSPATPSASDDEFMVGGGAASSSAAAAPSRRRPRLARDWDAAIGPGGVCFENYLAVRTGDAYPNWMFRCPHHHGCKRTRGVTVRNTARLGALEPLAYLHAWRDTPPGPRGHSNTEPPRQAIQDFFEEHREALETLARPQLEIP